MYHRYDKLGDAALVALVLAGEREAFDPLLLRYYPSVLRLCQRLLGSVSEAQDAAQEAALQAFLGLRQLQEPDRFGAWLHGTAANLARTALRRRRQLSLESLGTLQTVPTAAEASPEDTLVAREAHDAILAALDGLSVVNREAVVRFYMEGYSYSELSGLLAVPVSTIKGRLFKGRRQLMMSLESVAHEALKPDRRQKEHVMETEAMVEVSIEGIRTLQQDGNERKVAVLREEHSERVLPIWIGSFEAGSIDVALRGEQPARPLAHDLTLRMLETLGARIERVLVTNLVAATFYAQIVLRHDDHSYDVDARPSDGLALAVRAGVPIYVAREVIESSGFDPRQVSLEDFSAARQAEVAMILERQRVREGEQG